MGRIGVSAWRLTVAVAAILPLNSSFAATPTPAPASSTGDELAGVLAQVGATLKRTERPAWPRPSATSIQVTLAPQVDDAGELVASFGVPFPPDTLTDDKRIRVLGPDGQELPAFTKPLVSWWIDRKQGALRSVLVQVALKFPGKQAQKIAVAWDKTRTKSREATPIADTQFKKHEEPADKGNFDAYDWQSPKVLALLPADWLCSSLVAWQQVPEKENTQAPWYDKHLTEQFDESTKYISANRGAFEAHLFDRPATYAKIYVRRGEEKFLAAALKANDYYMQHVGADGYFDVKPGKDHKYIYSEGSAIMFMLTGDERYKEAIARMLKAWEAHTAIEYKGRGFWTERHHGFGMLALVHGYELTGEAAHLDKARRYFDAALSMQVKPVDGKAPDGAWVHSAESHGDGDGWTTSPWMSCFLIDGIWKYWMLTGDARAPASLAMYAKFDQKYAVTPDGKGVFYMANSPERGKSDNDESPPHNMEACYVMALGHYLSGGSDADFMKKFETLYPPILHDGANRPGRKFNWRFRETSMLVWFLREANGGGGRSSGSAPVVASGPAPASSATPPPAPAANARPVAAKGVQTPAAPAEPVASAKDIAGHRTALQAALRATAAKKTATSMTLFGRSESIKLDSADESEVRISYKANVLPVRWKDIPDSDLARMAFDCAPDDANALFHAAALALALKEAKLAENISERLSAVDPAKFKELNSLRR